MSEITDLLERFRRGAEFLATATTGVPNPEADFLPGPEKWTVRQIMAHVADSELVAGDRFRRIIAEDNPTLIGYDQNLWAANLNYSQRKISDALDTFRTIRADSYALLRSLPEEAFARTATHTEIGMITLLDELRTMAEHAEKHSRQILAVRQQYKASRAAKV